MDAATNESGHRIPSGPALLGVIGDLICGTLGGRLPQRHGDWCFETRLDEAPGAEESIGLRSLDLMDAATAVSEMFAIGELGQDDLLLARRTLGDWVALCQRCLAHYEASGGATILFKTSGTTGDPKCVRQSLSTLYDEVAFWAARFKDRRRIVAAVPSHHIYGFLFKALLADQLDVPVMDARHTLPGGLLSRLVPGDLLIGTPDFWQLLETFVARTATPLPGDIVGISSTAPLAAPTGDLLLDAGLSSLMEIYGSTETAGVGWRDVGGRGPFRLLPRWRRCERSGGLCDAASGDFAPLQDHLNWTGDDTFTVTGRRDGMVQVGGVNVSLDTVAQKITAFESVQECRVRLKKDVAGDRVVVDVILTEGVEKEAAHTSLHEAVKSVLPVGTAPDVNIIQ